MLERSRLKEIAAFSYQVIICQVQSHIGHGELFAAAATYYLEIIRYYNSVPVPSTTKLLQGTGEGLACDQKLVKIRVHVKTAYSTLSTTVKTLLSEYMRKCSKPTYCSWPPFLVPHFLSRCP